MLALALVLIVAGIYFQKEEEKEFNKLSKEEQIQKIYYDMAFRR